MIAHSDPLLYNNTDGTAYAALKETATAYDVREGEPPPKTPPVPEGAQEVAHRSGNGRGPDGRTLSASRPSAQDMEAGPAAGTPEASGCRAVHDFGSQLRAGTLGPCQLASLFRQTVSGFMEYKPATLREDKDGVDYWLSVTGEPRLVPCQLKIRPYRKRLSDVLVELAHIGPRKCWAGWIQDRPARVFLYLLPVPGKCLSVNGHELAGAWRKHGLAWADHFGVRLARNADYTTVSVPVAIAEVLAACPSARVLEVRV